MIASTRGLIADLAESAVDFLGDISGIAKQTGYEMKNNPNANKSDIDTAQKYIKDLNNALNGN